MSDLVFERDDEHTLTRDQYHRVRADIVLCAVERCNEVVHAKGVCRRHYEQWKGPGGLHPGPAHHAVVVRQLDDEDLAEVARRVEDDARPLFLAAMVWIVHQALAADEAESAS